ncbi:Tetratricopeptide repeat protein 6 [Myotis brandtii]|uniref:Tetratricopeptide repeat protein 6 n=1 Tax=Myotis brandtii TaxID=109478 RepID=S7NCJ6_MYOBR|nr:Tetratricopeptide repeat protein 6 [Myotis brandtii]
MLQLRGHRWLKAGLTEMSPIQQALIYSFCENHDKAIQVLDGATLNRPEINIIILLAKTQMKAKRTKEAVRLFKKALDVCSHSERGPHALEATVDCLYNLGLCYMDEGNFQMAFESFTKAVKINPNFAEGFHQRGLCKVKLHKDSSILDFNRAITLNPKHYEAYLNRVAFYGLKGRYSKAILNCNEAINIYPQSVRAYIYRGVLKYHNRTYKLAITDLTTAINMDKNSYVAFYNRALCYTKIGELQMAQEKFQKAWNHFTIAIEVDPKSYLAYEGRAVVCLQMGNNFAAIQDINFAIKINTTAEFLTNRGVIHEFMGQQQNAMRDYQAAISLNPTYALAYFNAGNIYFHHRQFSQVIDALVYNLRAEVRGKMGAIEEAMADYNQALDLQEYAK